MSLSSASFRSSQTPLHLGVVDGVAVAKMVMGVDWTGFGTSLRVRRLRTTPEYRVFSTQAGPAAASRRKGFRGPTYTFGEAKCRRPATGLSRVSDQDHKRFEQLIAVAVPPHDPPRCLSGIDSRHCPPCFHLLPALQSLRGTSVVWVISHGYGSPPYTTVCGRIEAGKSKRKCVDQSVHYCITDLAEAACVGQLLLLTRRPLPPRGENVSPRLL